ncbi:hypothetical protein GCM10007047_22490 [Cerasicoccus arenae]|uniref:Glycosyl hydrolases family 39 N-terminal catalytic domain-containing protein n=1 Tax=Cerasicoccus arenae TaxID=424488 RepID=A0A8J3GDB5_9BACT|nr:hypothetical protein GCM10007047_22490 [Cerasicoccus arenae]
MLSIACQSFAQTEPVVPPDSRIAAAPAGTQRLLLSSLDRGAVSYQAKWQLSSTNVESYLGLEPKVGAEVLKFSGVAQIAGAKGDFSIIDNPPGEIQMLGMWVYLAPESNVGKVGIQISDSEDESLTALVAADWEGWRWLEFNLLDDTFSQSYNQGDKTGRADFPLRNVHIVWFTERTGPSYFGVDALIASGTFESTATAYSIQSISPPWGEPGTPFQGQVAIHNFTEDTLEFKISSSLQTNPTYKRFTVPDSIHGSDHALGQPSWLEINGEHIDNNTLTDNEDNTGPTSIHPNIPKSGQNEIFQFVDLGQTREITKLAWIAGDSNWVNKIDVAASIDGNSYSQVESLQNLDLHKKWGEQSVLPDKPFPARFIRLRYHNDGNSLLEYFRTLSQLTIYDGVDDEAIVIPSFGKEITSETITIQVEPKNFSLIPFKATPPLNPDAYVFGMIAEAGSVKEMTLADYFVMPASVVEIRPESRFGINVSGLTNLPLLTRAGFGWVRFENMKWAFYNPAPDTFGFDGSVAPWNVPFDEYYAAYNEAGMSILPYIFITPDWASSAPAGVKRNSGGYPPKNLDDYGKAIFQAAARYGSNSVPADQLMTDDKLSALNMVNTYELWNEPNLSDPGWGFFVGTLSEYYLLFRNGAEAAKKADPNALVTNGGWAGSSMEWVDTMRTFQYPDGKTPLDFTDVMSTHFYSGKNEPETSTEDPNAYRDGAKPEEVQTLVKDLADLADWRDELKPSMPIWITELGNDVGGPMGLTERHQAAKLPRGNMLAFANGVEKVFIYRETGSVPAQHAGAGLIRDNASIRPSYFTVATQIRQFEGITETRVPRLDSGNPNVWMYYWKRTGGDVLTAWAPNDSGTLGLDLGHCLVTNAFGGETEMEVTKNFPLSMFPVYISEIGNMQPIESLLKKANQQEVARKKRSVFDSNASAALFDFGSTEYIGTKKVGKIRQFIPVLAEDVYDPEKRYGFSPESNGRNEFATWLWSPLEKDYVRFDQPSIFMVKPRPGTYRLQFKGKNFREGDELIVTGSSRAEIRIPLEPGDYGSPTETVTLVITDRQMLEIKMPAGRIEWLTLIEIPAK